jgi:hypothetical protein
MQSGSAAIANRSRVNCKAIARQLRSDGNLIALRFGGDWKWIA